MHAQNERRSGGGFLKGMLWGAAAGAAVALLFAPKPGKELRRDLSRSARRMQKQAVRKYEDAAETVEDIVGRGKEMFDSVVEQSTDALSKGRAAFDQARHGAKRPANGDPRA